MSATVVEQLKHFVQARLPALDVLSVEPLDGVVTSQIWMVAATQRVDGQQRERGLVLRAHQPGGPLDRGALDKAQEFALLRALAATPIPVPCPAFADAGDNPLGVPLFVMDRSPGDPSVEALRSDEALRTLLIEELAGHLAALHRLDWRSLGVDFLGGRDATVGAFDWFAGWLDVHRESGADDPPLLRELVCWLADHAPERFDVALCWGDPGPGNFLVHDRRISALLDWELAHLGDPLDDLGFLVWRFEQALGTDGDIHQVLIDAYGRAAGTAADAAAVRYFTVMAYAKAALWSTLGTRGFALGRSRSPEHAISAPRLARLWLRRGAELAGM